MILKTVKLAAECGIPGLQFVTVDKQITEVILGKVRIRKGENYGKAIEVLVEAPFEKEERHRLVGKIKGFPDAVSYHQTKYDADSASAALEDAGATVAVERVDVLIDAEGNVAGEADTTTELKREMADVPF